MEFQSKTPREFEHYALFRQAAALLASSIELEQALFNTISVCLPYLADFGFFDVILESGVRRTARAHLDPELEALLQRTSWQRNQRTDINLCALSSGEPVLHANTDDDWYAAAFNAPRALPFRSMLSVPLRFGNELLGSLTLFMANSDRNHDEGHLRLALEIADLASPVVVNAKLLHRERRAQLALKHSEERLRLATQAAKIGIWDWSIPDNKVTWSDRVYELHGLAPGQFGGTVEDFGKLVHPDDQAVVLANITKALVEAETLTDEFRVVWPDDSVHWLTTSSYIERDASGQAVRMLGSTIDITEQKILQFGLEALNTQLSKQAATSTSERDRIWRISKDMLVVASFSGYLISVNPAFTRVLGWGEQEVLSFPFLELCHPHQRDEILEVLADLATGRQVENFEVQSLHKDGTYRWLSWTIAAEGELLYAVGRDVTATRQQREHAHRTTEARFQLALKAGGMGAWQWDLTNGAVHWWPGMEIIHGLPSGSGITRAADYLQFVHPDDASRVNLSQEDMLTPRTFADVEYRIIWPDGSIRWIETRREQILDQNGLPTKLAGVCLDITERKLTEQNLRFLADASAEFADVVDYKKTLQKVAQLAVPTFADWCTVDLLDDEGALKRVSVHHVDPSKIQLAHDLYEKYPPDPSAPLGTWQILRTGQAELVAEINDEILQESIKDEDYLGIIRQLGLCSYIGVPLTVRGKTLGVLTFISAESRRIYGSRDVALASDIGRRAAIAIENSSFYLALKEADRRKDDFLAMLAHELRNPLAPIKAAADLLNFPLPTERLKKTSEIITRQVNHMTGLVDDLLDVSRVTRGQIRIEKKPTDVKRVIAVALEQTRHQIESKRHRLTVNIPDNGGYVDGDEERLVQVISNLLGNAAKFTPEHGCIDVNLILTDAKIEISVRDNGIGMAEDLLTSAFDLFVQGKRAADRSQGGLGLGLALVRTIITLHDGAVFARSEGEGFGTELIVRLPRLFIPGTTEITDSKPSYSAPRSLSIMIVDDNKDAADTLAFYLQALGHRVQVVYHPYDALDKISVNDFDKIFLDIGLPEMTGLELATRIRAKLGEATPTLIAVSGYGQPADRDAALSVGIDHYFVKPLDVKLLSDIVIS